MKAFNEAMSAKDLVPRDIEATGASAVPIVTDLIALPENASYRTEATGYIVPPISTVLGMSTTVSGPDPRIPVTAALPSSR